MASFNAAVDSAYNQYQATFEATLVAARSGFASVQATLDAVTASADQAWDALATAATIAYNSTERNAWATYVVAAQAAWNAYFATTSGAQSVVMNQQLTAAQVNLLAMPGPAQPQPPVVQPRQQMPPAQAPGPRVKPALPDPIKLIPKPDGTGFKLVVPLLKYELKFIPGIPKLTVGTQLDFTPFPKPGKSHFDLSLKIGLEGKF